MGVDRDRGLNRSARFGAPFAVAAGFLFAAPPVPAVPDCASLPRTHVLAADQGRLESITSDARGRLFYTDLTDNRLLRLDGPGKRPRVLSEGIARPGGLAFEPDGSLVTGFNGGPLSGVPGNGMAGMYRIDPETGVKRLFVDELDQANGVVRGPDGAIYASNNIAGEIVRVLPDGRAQDWADVESANGLSIDTRRRYVFAAQTFTPAKIARVELAHPERVTTFFAASSADMAAGLDGLTRDGADRLFVAANGAGEVWRVGLDGQACALARSLGLPSALAFGGGASGFARRNLYVVTFTGGVIELEKATNRPPAPPPPPRLRLSVSPRVARFGQPVEFAFLVTVGPSGQPVAGAKIRFAKEIAFTDRRGRATIVQRFTKPNSYHPHARKAGFHTGKTSVRIVG